VLGGERALYHIWETSPAVYGTSGAPLAAKVFLETSTLCVQNADGRLQISPCGGDRQVYSRAKTMLGWRQARHSFGRNPGTAPGPGA